MAARQVKVRSKVACSAEFIRLIENEWLPLLRPQRQQFRNRSLPLAFPRRVTEGIPKVTFEFSRIQAKAA